MAAWSVTSSTCLCTPVRVSRAAPLMSTAKTSAPAF
nr:hypothetical protein [Tanacetum cinerariifolium]